MNDQDSARIATLESKVAELEAALAAKERQNSDLTKADSSRLSRRRLMYTSGAVAAGTVFASGKPAAAQQQVPASDVTFIPAGDVSATNVQDALEEVDLDKAALAGAEFTGLTRFVDAQFVTRPWADIRAHGATGDGMTDDTGAIKNAITWVDGTGGGTVLIPPGKYRITAPVTVPAGVDLWGCGGHQTAGRNRGSVILAGGPDAQLIFEGLGGQSGNFLFEGQSVFQSSEKGLIYIHKTIERIFVAMRVSNSRKDGIVTEGIQNCTFLQLGVHHSYRDALVVDTHSENNIFIRAELSGAVRNNLTIQHSSPGPNVRGPEKNHFIRCLIERGQLVDGEWKGPNNSMMTATGGFNNLFTFCGFHLGGAHPMPDSEFLVVADGDLNLGFDTCQFGSSIPGVGALHAKGNAGVRFQGHCTFATGTTQNPGRGILWESSGLASTMGMMDFRHNSRWEVMTRRRQNTPFETGFTRLNAQEHLSFVPDLDGAQAAIYVRNGEFVVAYQDGPTMRYRTMDLTGTDTAWTHSTTAP